jgi:hypothetical protein
VIERRDDRVIERRDEGVIDRDERVLEREKK